MALHVVVTELCQGHGRCFIECPEVFVSDDAGYSTVVTPDPPASFDAAVKRAAEACPEGAITWTDIADEAAGADTEA